MQRLLHSRVFLQIQPDAEDGGHADRTKVNKTSQRWRLFWPLRVTMSFFLLMVIWSDWDRQDSGLPSGHCRSWFFAAHVGNPIGKTPSFSGAFSSFDLLGDQLPCDLDPLEKPVGQMKVQ